jgi:hypothetical protein
MVRRYPSELNSDDPPSTKEVTETTFVTLPDEDVGATKAHVMARPAMRDARLRTIALQMNPPGTIPLSVVDYEDEGKVLPIPVMQVSRGDSESNGVTVASRDGRWLTLPKSRRNVQRRFCAV